MFGLFLRAIAIALTCSALTACGSRPKQVAPIEQVYEIRAAVVTANAGISHTILNGIKQRMDQAIADTRRPVPMPRAVMTIHVVDVARALAVDGVRTQTEVSVALADVPSGVPVLVRNFMVYSFALDQRTADDGAAEAIAARLRVEYALNQPVIRSDNVPVSRLSTRMKSEKYRDQPTEDRPIVVPLKTVRAIGADQDPLLNSKTRVEPEKAKASVPESSLKAADTAPVENALEAGAKAKVVIKPRAAQPTDDEPCVETMDTKC